MFVPDPEFSHGVSKGQKRTGSRIPGSGSVELVLMPIQILIRLSILYADPNPDPSYPKFYTCWKIRNWLLFTAVAVYIVFIFLIGVTGVLNIFESILKFSGKKHTGILALQLWLKWIRIRQNGAVPTGSGSSTLVFVKYDVTRYQHPGTIVYYPADPHYPVKSHSYFFFKVP